MQSDGGDWPKVSVCIPVKNGGSRLGKCLQSLRDVDYPGDRLEVIIADGNSTDNTREVAQSFGVTVIDNPGEIVASGRNVSFALASGEFIASTDDDCVVPRNWIKEALAGFADPEVAAVGGISLLPEDAPLWARAVNYIFRLASIAGYSVQADHLSAGHAEDLPGCNTFYRSTAYRAVGDFDEALITAEDVDLHARMRARDQRLVASPSLFVWHDKRPTPRGLFRQMRRFAEGRVQLSRKMPHLLRPLHRLAGWAVPIVATAIVASIAADLATWIAAGAIGVGIALILKAMMDRQSPAVAFAVPVALAITITGWSFGYLKESWFPMRSTVGR